MSPAERSFYAVLCQACDSKAIVFSKTKMRGVLNAQQRLVQQQKLRASNVNTSKAVMHSECLKLQKNLNKVANSHFDFILCDRLTLQVLAVVELDNTVAACAKASAKEKAQQAKRNRKLEAACKAVKLEFHLLSGAQKYSVTDLEMALFNECADRSALTNVESR